MNQNLSGLHSPYSKNHLFELSLLQDLTGLFGAFYDNLSLKTPLIRNLQQLSQIV